MMTNKTLLGFRIACTGLSHVRRILLPLLCVLLMAAGCGREESGVLVGTAAGGGDVARLVKARRVEEREMISTHRFPGKVKAAAEVDLSFRVSGTLVELPVKEGQEVEKGVLLARLDPRDFETEITNVRSQSQQAEAKLKAMLAGEREEDIRSLEAKVASARARFNEANLNFERYEKLHESRVVSRQEYDNALATRDVAQAALDSALQELEKGRRGARAEDLDAQRSLIRSLEARLQQAQNALVDTGLLAPFAGRVSRVHVENHQDITAKSPVVKLHDLSDAVQVVVAVPEMLVMQHRQEDASLEVSFEFLPGRSFPAKVLEVTTEADSRTRTFDVTLTMPPVGDVNILPGMTAVVTAKVKNPNEVRGMVAVPQEAVFADGGGASHVWVVDAATSTVSSRTVRMGRLRGDRVEVLEGLTPGERVVVAGVHHLQEGQKVRLMQANAGGGRS
jgi:membrane fusion protein, multidrug efflux system